MSSPATFYGPPSSPPAPPTGFDDADEEVMPEGRPMRVKVLYTFDDDNKTNCLARFPHALSIPTVALDNNTQIGIIELRKCIEAIINASPELVAKLGQDYTVYAYDYSEYETPLVGQGMLSWVLASASSTPDAAAHQSSTMITGRVCKNIMGLFSNGVKETLEVKLRLVPVPTCLQSEYLASLQKHRGGSEMAHSSLDSGVWTSDVGQVAAGSAVTSDQPSQGSGGIEDIHHLLTQGYNSHRSRALPRGDDALMSDAGYSTQASRAGSPTPSQQSNAGSRAQARYPPLRPSSRASVSSNRSILPRKENLAYHEQSETQGHDQQDGPARKKARVMKADWKGKSSALGSADSLRVTASTANSIRVHRPVPVRPSGDRTHSLEPPPRVPTPIPESGASTRPLLRTVSTSQLRRASTLSSDGNYTSPYALDEAREQSQPAWAFSPQDENQNSVNTSPSEIPSSPPEFAPPSSPPLPLYTPNLNFVSAPVMHRPSEDHEERPVDEEDSATASKWRRRPKTKRPDKEGFCEVIPGPLELLPQRMPERLHELDRQRRLQQEENAKKAQEANQSAAIGTQKQSQDHTTNETQPIPNRKLSATSLALPTPRPASEIGPSSHPGDPKRTLSSVTDSTEVQTSGASPQPTAAEGMNDRSSSSAAASRQRIANRLAESLARGQTPPYCQHCGEINTPTWRTAFCKFEEGQMPEVTYSGAKGAISALQSLEQDEHGRTKRYMVIKKSINDKVETGFRPFQLCNPCGLWLNKLKGMRPQKVWHKSSTDRRRREFLKKMQQAGCTEPQSDFGPTMASMLDTDRVSPEDTTNLQQNFDEPPSREGPTEKRPDSDAVPFKEEVNVGNTRMDETFAAAALKRAIQSSPARLIGSQQSPIELGDDLTPKPTRRLLFPSPRRGGQIKTLDDTRSSPINHSSNHTKTNSNPSFVVDDAQNDKENCPPPLDAEDDLNNIFQDITFPLAKTPEKTRSPMSTNTFKTPTPASRRKLPLSPSNLLSSATRALRSTPSSARASASKLLQTLLSPSQSREHQQLTPFTAQLNQLLSESLSSPSAHSFQNFEFEALPSLGFTEDDIAHFGHNMGGGGFDADFFSTDALVPPSSPPPAAMVNTFGVYEDPLEDNEVLGIEAAGEQSWDAESLFGKSPGAGLKKLAGADEEVVDGPKALNVVDGAGQDGKSVAPAVEA
ncbi:hypothetical protein EV356DRAFT_568075 [Viridothelium virens]|uniref:Ams2/SPT21 N-terminal domain-containing protein n=1 Tax=Viridothelium virens TaxID=1048519 RepID=A0A6A6H665_VIRVR|nr:hypothetical protein EV356DRAFT_568075 [Viridothelium virens]